MANMEKTSKKVAEKASDLVKETKDKVKSAASCALNQASDKKKCKK